MDEKKHPLPKLDSDVLPEEMLVRQQQVRIMQEQLEVIAMPFAPGFDLSKLGILADALVTEQIMLTQTVIPAMMQPREDESDIGIHVWKLPRLVRSATQADPEVEVAEYECPKRLEEVDDAAEALSMALAFAFVHLPVARALLRMHGWTYKFDAPKDEPEGGEDDGDQDDGGEDSSVDASPPKSA